MFKNILLTLLTTLTFGCGYGSTGTPSTPTGNLLFSRGYGADEAVGDTEKFVDSNVKLITSTVGATIKATGRGSKKVVTDGILIAEDTYDIEVKNKDGVVVKTGVVKLNKTPINRSDVQAVAAAPNGFTENSEVDQSFFTVSLNKEGPAADKRSILDKYEYVVIITTTHRSAGDDIKSVSYQKISDLAPSKDLDAHLLSEGQTKVQVFLVPYFVGLDLNGISEATLNVANAVMVQDWNLQSTNVISFDLVEGSYAINNGVLVVEVKKGEKVTIKLDDSIKGYALFSGEYIGDEVLTDVGKFTRIDVPQPLGAGEFTLVPIMDDGGEELNHDYVRKIEVVELSQSQPLSVSVGGTQLDPTQISGIKTAKSFIVSNLPDGIQLSDITLCEADYDKATNDEGAYAPLEGGNLEHPDEASAFAPKDGFKNGKVYALKVGDVTYKFYLDSTLMDYVPALGVRFNVVGSGETDEVNFNGDMLKVSSFNPYIVNHDDTITYKFALSADDVELVSETTLTNDLLDDGTNNIKLISSDSKAGNGGNLVKFTPIPSAGAIKYKVIITCSKNGASSQPVMMEFGVVAASSVKVSVEGSPLALFDGSALSANIMANPAIDIEKASDSDPDSTIRIILRKISKNHVDLPLGEDIAILLPGTDKHALIGDKSVSEDLDMKNAVYMLELYSAFGVGDDYNKNNEVCSKYMIAGNNSLHLPTEVTVSSNNELTNFAVDPKGTNVITVAVNDILTLVHNPFTKTGSAALVEYDDNAESSHTFVVDDRAAGNISTKHINVSYTYTITDTNIVNNPIDVTVDDVIFTIPFKIEDAASDLNQPNVEAFLGTASGEKRIGSVAYVGDVVVLKLAAEDGVDYKWGTTDPTIAMKDEVEGGTLTIWDSMADFSNNAATIDGVEDETSYYVYAKEGVKFNYQRVLEAKAKFSVIFKSDDGGSLYEVQNKNMLYKGSPLIAEVTGDHNDFDATYTLFKYNGAEYVKSGHVENMTWDTDKFVVDVTNSVDSQNYAIRLQIQHIMPNYIDEHVMKSYIDIYFKTGAPNREDVISNIRFIGLDVSDNILANIDVFNNNTRSIPDLTKGYVTLDLGPNFNERLHEVEVFFDNVTPGTDPTTQVTARQSANMNLANGEVLAIRVVLTNLQSGQSKELERIAFKASVPRVQVHRKGRLLGSNERDTTIFDLDETKVFSFNYENVYIRLLDDSDHKLDFTVSSDSAVDGLSFVPRNKKTIELHFANEYNGTTLISPTANNVKITYGGQDYYFTFVRLPKGIVGTGVIDTTNNPSIVHFNRGEGEPSAAE